MDLGILGEHLSGGKGTLLAVCVVKVDVTGDYRAYKQARVSVPATVTTRTHDDVLDIEIRCSMGPQMELPIFVLCVLVFSASIRIAAYVEDFADIS